MRKTGWPQQPLAQDDHRKLFAWFASKPDARRLVRERCKEIEGEHMNQHTEPEPTTDRELLELAAKAAGIRYDKEASKPHPKSGAFWGLWLVFDGEPPEHARRHWNPLTDDGDALRLAVKLGIGAGRCFQVVIDSEIDRTGVRHTDRGGKYDSLEEHGTDPYAATRRAIFRAAAEIGKAMPCA